MKSGGPGYIKPDATTFPSLVEMNAFVEECGALPCAAWLNGFTAGEKDPEELLSFHKSKGLKALAIIPDRNWNISDPAKKEASILLSKLKKLISEFKLESEDLVPLCHPRYSSTPFIIISLYLQIGTQLLMLQKKKM